MYIDRAGKYLLPDRSNIHESVILVINYKNQYRKLSFHAAAQLTAREGFLLKISKLDVFYPEKLEGIKL